MLFSGTRAATIAPTDANVRASTRNATPPIPEKMSLGTARSGPTASRTAVGTAIAAHSAQASTATRRPIIEPLSLRGPRNETVRPLGPKQYWH